MYKKSTNALLLALDQVLADQILGESYLINFSSIFLNLTTNLQYVPEKLLRTTSSLIVQIIALKISEKT